MHCSFVVCFRWKKFGWGGTVRTIFSNSEIRPSSNLKEVDVGYEKDMILKPTYFFYFTAFE